MINPYYRMAPSPVVSVGESFRDPATRERIMPFAPRADRADQRDRREGLRVLAHAQDAVDTSRPVGRPATAWVGQVLPRGTADRVGAGATFHGSRMVTDGADSPHTLISEMHGSYLIAIAENDHERQPEARGVMESAFGGAGVTAEIEVYEDAMHGWCALDSRAHHPEQAARAHWRLLETFRTALA